MGKLQRPFLLIPASQMIYLQLFIIEGLLPIATGIASFWLIPDFPSTSSWLSHAEVATINSWLHKDAPTEHAKGFSVSESLAIFKDPT